MIIHDSKIIFIHIPKTGGTTIEKILVSNKEVGEPDTYFGTHHRLDQVYQKFSSSDTPPEDYVDLSGYHIFVVSRNPWERYSSLYVHDKFAWESIPKNRKRTFVSIEEYMDTMVSENFFSFIEVNGVIPDNLMIVDFHDFAAEVKRVFDVMGLKCGRIFHENKKTHRQKTLQRKTLENDYFQQAVSKLCEKEIALFNYGLPDYGK